HQNYEGVVLWIGSGSEHLNGCANTIPKSRTARRSLALHRHVYRIPGGGSGVTSSGDKGIANRCGSLKPNHAELIIWRAILQFPFCDELIDCPLQHDHLDVSAAEDRIGHAA